MKKTMFSVLGVVFGLTLSTVAASATLGAPDTQATQRYIAGVITAVDARSVTIHGKTAVTGRITDATRVTVDGRPGRAADLKLTENAKAEIGLDDVWATIAVSTK
jgi:hypothetical protein